MIGTVLRIGFTNLRRDRVAQALSFLLPIVFFSIFAAIFAGQGGRSTPRVDVAVVDEDGSDVSARLVAALRAEPGLRVRTLEKDAATGVEVVLGRADARSLVQTGGVPVAVVFPKGFGAGGLSFGGPDRPTVTIYTDPSDPVAPQVVNGLLQKVAMTAAPDIMLRTGLESFERHAGAFTPEQRAAVDAWLPEMKNAALQPAPAPGATPGAGSAAPAQGLIATELVDVLREGRQDKSIVAFYAAGIGVMFLLFTASAAAGALIDEQDSGTLERLLSTRLGMGRLLAGKWLYLTILGSLQMAVMFTWGALVFHLDLLGHLAGFVLVTSCTTAAAAGFGLVLATACRTRAQLGGLSTIVILVMSALGGSMFPRFLMPEGLQKAGLVTFNGWALDAYLKVFWREAPLADLWPQLLVLAGMTVAFLTVTRLLARRWERS